MTTFAALGDSITLGIGDRGPGRAWRGWAVLLADGLREPRLHNLSASGAQSADVERDQLPRALELRPDVASVIVGINDTLRSSFDPRRIHIVNTIMDDVSAQFGALVFDAARDPGTYDRRMWSVDRMHPSERGHQLIAARFHDQLAAAGMPLGPRPKAEPTRPPPTRRAQAAWMATKGTGWVIRRPAGTGVAGP
jgi:lysophospholipase L1-like esterase